jgi:hypothetical protein
LVTGTERICGSREWCGKGRKERERERKMRARGTRTVEGREQIEI